MGRVFKGLLAAVWMLGTASTAIAQDRPSVVAVNHPLTYFAERLLGDAAEVVFPVPEGVDPSFWRPSISDISTIQSADLILLNGAGFATWIDRVSLPRSRVVNTSAAIRDEFIVTESVTHSHGDGGEHSHEGLASYTWLDPTLAVAQAEAIAAAIATRELASPEDVYANFDDLRRDLEAVDAKATADFEGVQTVSIIATHPRYQYLARRYGLSIASLEWDAGAMPTADELDDLEALAKETNARILIWEAEPPSAAIDATTDLGLLSVVFDPLASGPRDVSYVAAFSEALAGLATAMTQSAGN